ncbi:MAG: RNase P subunit p30 family protein [archaeon]
MIDLIYFNEKAFPDLKELIDLEKRIGNKGVILAKKFSSEKEAKELKEKTEKTIKELKIKGFDLKLAHLITKTDAKETRKFKGKIDLIAVEGGDVTINKFAVSTAGINLLLNPYKEGKLSFDTAIARIASENKVAVGITFSHFLQSRGFNRINSFKNYSFIVKLIQKFKIPVNVFSGATELNEIRSIKDLNAFLVLLGYSREKLKSDLE